MKRLIGFDLFIGIRFQVICAWGNFFFDLVGDRLDSLLLLSFQPIGYPTPQRNPHNFPLATPIRLVAHFRKLYLSRISSENV